MMNSNQLHRYIGYMGCVLLSLANSVLAQTNGFQFQTITLPFSANRSIFADVDNDRREDLLAIDPGQKRLLIYRQRESGFTNVAAQTIELPGRTAWVAVHDIDRHSGAELLASTATGVVYYRQNGGVFEAEPRKFLDIDQVFTNEDLPTLISLGTNGSIPVISATEAVLYRRNEGFEWRPAQTVPLEPADAFWSSGRDEWSMGANPAYHLGVRQSFRAKRNKSVEQPENEAIRKILEGMKKTISPRLVGTNHFDVNGDGRKDAIFWQFFPGLDPKTDIYLFLRGADGKLPDRPTQILHCRGFPIPVGSTHPPFSPVARLKNDGAYQVVLVELATTMTSASSLLDMALSGGLECALTIRSFNGATFSGNPEATIPIRTIMPIVTFAPVEDLNYELFFLCGDFNGDGRPDLIVKRATSQWSIFFSTADGRWFAPQPAVTFDTPMQGNFEIKDLNGDGRSDIILRAWDDARIFVGLSQAKP